MQPSDRITDKMRDAVHKVFVRIDFDDYGQKDLDAICRAVLDAAEVTPEMVERASFEHWKHPLTFETPDDAVRCWAKVSSTERNSHRAMVRRVLIATLHGDSQ